MHSSMFHHNFWQQAVLACTNFCNCCWEQVTPVLLNSLAEASDSRSICTQQQSSCEGESRCLLQWIGQPADTAWRCSSPLSPTSWPAGASLTCMQLISDGVQCGGRGCNQCRW